AEDLSNNLALEVRTVSGRLVSQICASPQDTVGTLKLRVLQSSSDQELRRSCAPFGLIHGLSVLRDSTRLDELKYAAADGCLAMTL
ncbi:unnamed protein product, partial [Polarella glacialis]